MIATIYFTFFILLVVAIFFVFFLLLMFLKWFLEMFFENAWLKSDAQNKQSETQHIRFLIRKGLDKQNVYS